MATAFAPADAEWLAALVKRHAFNSRNNCWHPCITEWVEKRMDELCAASPPLSQADVFERIIRDAPGKRGNQLTFLGEDRAAVDEAIARCTADCKTDFKWARVNFDGRDKFGVLVSPPGPIVIDDTYEGHWQHEWCKQNADFIAACGRNLFPRMERQIMDARNAGVMQLIWYGDSIIWCTGKDVVDHLNSQATEPYVGMERWIESKISIGIAPPPPTAEEMAQARADMMAFFAGLPGSDADTGSDTSDSDNSD